MYTSKRKTLLLGIFGAILVIGCGYFAWNSRTVPDDPAPGFARYENAELGYSVEYPEGWKLMPQSSLDKEVIINPVDAENFVGYLSISIDARTIDTIQTVYHLNPGEWKETSIGFAGESSYEFDNQSSATKNIFIPHDDRIYLVATDKSGDVQVEKALASFRFLKN